MLATYRGVVENGRIRLRDAVLPDGVEVIVVARLPSSIEEQRQRFAALPANEWRKPFEAVHRVYHQAALAELENETLTDERDLLDDSTLVRGLRDEWNIRVIHSGDFLSLIR